MVFTFQISLATTNHLELWAQTLWWFTGFCSDIFSQQWQKMHAMQTSLYIKNWKLAKLSLCFDVSVTLTISEAPDPPPRSFPPQQQGQAASCQRHQSFESNQGWAILPLPCSLNNRPGAVCIYPVWSETSVAFCTLRSACVLAKSGASVKQRCKREKEAEVDLSFCQISVYSQWNHHHLLLYSAVAKATEGSRALFHHDLEYTIFTFMRLAFDCD